MIPRHLLLAALIRDELTTLNEAAVRIERFWQRAATAGAGGLRLCRQWKGRNGVNWYAEEVA